jgi:Holliday junction DNA helicase RuvA
MIAHLNGILAERGPESCVVEAGGVGYEVFLPAPTLLALPAIGQTVRLYTHFHVREDAQVLYGFLRTQDRQVFLLLLTVKGVGPRVALAILSSLGAETLVQALIQRDLATLNRVPGVGKKLAERLGVEISDKARQLGLDSSLAGAPRLNPDLPEAWSQAASALAALGYSQSQARQAVDRAYKMWGQEDMTLEDRVKAALKTV